MQNEVRQWLNNPAKKYEDGVALFKKYKNDAVLSKYFSGSDPGRDHMKYKMLIRKLNDIDRILQANPTLIKSAPPTVKPINVNEISEIASRRLRELRPKVTPIITEEPIVDVKQLPDNLKELYFENKKLLQKRAGYHLQSSKIDESPKYDDKRKEIDDKIIKIDDEMAANRKIINDWWKSKQSEPVEKPKEKEASLSDKVKKINNLTNYINRANAKIRDFPEEKEKLEPKIKKWQTELDELKKE